MTTILYSYQQLLRAPVVPQPPQRLLMSLFQILAILEVSSDIALFSFVFP